MQYAYVIEFGIDFSNLLWNQIEGIYIFQNFPNKFSKKKKLLAQQKIFQEALHAPQGDSELKNVVNILVSSLERGYYLGIIKGSLYMGGNILVKATCV